MNTIPESFDEYRARTVSEAKKPAEWHEHKIAVDTVRNPSKGLLGGPSAEEAETKLRGKFGYSDKEIGLLKKVSVDEASGKPVTREIIRRGMDGYFKDYEYGFLEEDPSTLVVSHTGTDRKPTKKDLEEAAAEVAEYFASKGHKVVCVKDTVVFHDLADGVDEASAFWGKEQIKWFTVLDNKVGNLATVLLWLRGWYPTEERFKADRARIEQAIEGLKTSSDEISELADEIGDYLKSTLAGMNTYKARI